MAEFAWKRTSDYWTATVWPSRFPYAVAHQNPGRRVVDRDRIYRVKIHGHAGMRWLDYVGQRPNSPRW